MKNHILKRLFKENITLENIVENILGLEIYKTLKKEFLEIGIGGALVYGLQTKDSDIDILIYGNNLNNIINILRDSNIFFQIKIPENISEDLGIRKYISIDKNKFRGIPIQIHIEEAPLKFQHLPIHSNFLKRRFENERILYRYILDLKLKAEIGAREGYRKAHILVFEKQMQEDLGFVPKRIEVSKLGIKYPRWDSKLNPFDWIFLREVYGIEKGLEIAKKNNLIDQNFEIINSSTK